jgi:hypothetical protein
MDHTLDAVARPARFDRVMRSAADGDAELAKIREERRRLRLEDTRRFCEIVATDNPFSIGFDEAVDLSFMLTSAEVFDVLVVQLGWPVERWKQAITWMMEKVALD